MRERQVNQELVGIQRSLARTKPEYVDMTRRNMYLVRAVDVSYESLYEGPALRRAIWRYEALWLPLLLAVLLPASATPSDPALAAKVGHIRAKNAAGDGLTSSSLVPPLDIAWVWLLHRLHPGAYAADTAGLTSANEVLHTDADTAFRFSDGEDAQSKPLRRLWDVLYPFEPYLPAYILNTPYAVDEKKKKEAVDTYAHAVGESGRATERSIVSFDVEASAILQKRFVFQTVDPRAGLEWDAIEEDEFLLRAFDRYMMFTLLRKRQPDTYLVPMMDINLVWHAHMASTRDYHADCIALVGGVVGHDALDAEARRQDLIQQERAVLEADGDLYSDGEETALALKLNFRGLPIAETRSLWEEAYGLSPAYDIPGTRYRGEPVGPRGGFRTVWEAEFGSRSARNGHEMLAVMVLSASLVAAGVVAAAFGLIATVARHGAWFLAVPGGLGLAAGGVAMFVALPSARPLSSTSRFWVDRRYKHMHNPLPSYLVRTKAFHLD